LFTVIVSILIKIYLQKFAKDIDEKLVSVSNFSLMITKINDAIDPIDLKVYLEREFRDIPIKIEIVSYCYDFQILVS